MLSDLALYAALLRPVARLPSPIPRASFTATPAHLQQLVLRGQSNKRCCIVDFKLSKQVAAVGFDSEGAQEQLIGNILAGKTLCDKASHFLFAARERGHRRHGRRGLQQQHEVHGLEAGLHAALRLGAAGKLHPGVSLSQLLNVSRNGFGYSYVQPELCHAVGRLLSPRASFMP